MWQINVMIIQKILYSYKYEKIEKEYFYPKKIDVLT